VISKGKPHKAPGRDRIGLGFYKKTLELMQPDLFQITNCMYSDGTILARQLQELIVCIPKHTHPNKVDE